MTATQKINKAATLLVAAKKYLNQGNTVKLVCLIEQIKGLHNEVRIELNNL